MRRLVWGLLSATALLLPSTPTLAQQVPGAVVVSACGTPPGTATVGQVLSQSMDTTGVLCTSSGSSSSGGVAGVTASATPTAVVAGTNKPMNEGLFSNLFVTQVDSSGNIVDLTAPVPVGGQVASGVAVSGNPLLSGCRAATAAPTDVTGGQAVANLCGAEGKQVVLPYSIKETAVRGSTGAITNTAQTQIIGAGAGSLRNYITAIQCANSGSSTSILTFTDANTTVLINPAGGGGNWTFPVPLQTAAATAFQVTPGTSSTSQYCSAQGYTGL